MKNRDDDFDVEILEVCNDADLDYIVADVCSDAEILECDVFDVNTISALIVEAEDVDKC